MSDINWGLLSSSNAPLANPVDVLRAGVADRDAQVKTALAQQKQQADLAEAARQQAAQQTAGQAYGSGDTRGAQAALIGTGQTDLLGGVTTADTNQFNQHQDGIKAVSGFAQYVRDYIADPATRAAVINHNAPLLQAAGAHPDDIAAIASNPTDDNLNGAIGLAYSAHDQNSDAVAKQNANTTAAHLPIDQENADTQRMAELRQQTTPVFGAPGDTPFLPGGATVGSAGGTAAPDYNITVGGGHANLTGMNLGQAIDYGRNTLIPQTRNNASLGLSNGQGSSAMGAFQITQGTLAQYAPQVFGPNWQSVPFTPENQEKLAQAIYDANKGGNLKAQWTSLPNATPGAYANMPWSQARNLIIQGESGGSVHGPTMLPTLAPKADPNAVDPADPAVELAAHQYAATGDMPALGQGNGPMRHAILTRAAQIVQQNHWGPAQIAANKAQVRASTQALSGDNKMFDVIQTAEQTALSNGQRYVDLAAQMPGNTHSTLYNGARNALGAMFSDTRVTDANTAYQTFIGEYNKVVNTSPMGSGTLSDASRREAEATFANDTSPEAKRKAFEVMKADMAARRQAQQNIIDRRTASIANIGQTPSPAPHAAPQQSASNAPSGATLVGTSRKTGRPVYRLPNGAMVLG